MKCVDVLRRDSERILVRLDRVIDAAAAFEGEPEGTDPEATPSEQVH